MKILAINSSPRKVGESKTEMMMRALVEGMDKAGAQVETIHLKEKKINDCIGCFSCWGVTPGKCIQADDMSRELFPKYLEADIVVLASPLYHFTVNASMKRFIERTLPVAKAEIRQDEDEGRSYHPLRFQLPKIVMVSVAGFSEDKVFDQLTSWARFLYKTLLIAEIYRPHAETMVFHEDQFATILAAVSTAGGELVNSEKVSSDTMATILKPLEIKE